MSIPSVALGMSKIYSVVPVDGRVAAAASVRGVPQDEDDEEDEEEDQDDEEGHGNDEDAEGKEDEDQREGYSV